MATVTTSFSSAENIQTAYEIAMNGMPLETAVIFSTAAFDRTNEWSPSYYGISTSSNITGGYSNGDTFSAYGSNLRSYPYTVNELEYFFDSEQVAVTLEGSVTRDNSYSDLRGHINNITVDDGASLVEVIGFTDVRTPTHSITQFYLATNGVRLTYDGNLTSEVSIQNNFYQASIEGSISDFTLEYNGEVLQVDGINLSYDDALSTTSATDLLSSILSGNDTVHGSPASDYLFGFAGNDTLNGGSGDDLLEGGAGDDVIRGGIGLDTVVYSKPSSSYLVEFDPNSGSYSVSDTQTSETDTTYGVEKIQFNDETVSLATFLELDDISLIDTGLSETTEVAIQQIFVGLLGRPVKESGETYWKEQVEEDNGFGLTELMSNIVNEQAEYINAFTGLTRADAVTLHFNYLFSRDPNFDGGGNNYWVNGGGETIPTNELVLALLQGAQGNDIQTLSNKMFVADYISDKEAELASPAGVEILGSVNSDLDSVVSAVTEVDLFG